MRDGGDWIIYLFAALFALHATITIGVVLYRLTKKPKSMKRKEEDVNSD